MSIPKRSDRFNNDSTLVLATARTNSTTEPDDENRLAKPNAQRSDEERLSLFWRVFGGAIMSVAALVGLTLFNNINSTISEMRSEIARLNEARAEWVKKEEVFILRQQVNLHEGLKIELDAFKERANKGRADLDAVSKEAKDTAATIKGVTSTLESLKERLTELKNVREETAKVRQDVDKNQAADLERKERRDAQYKQYEEAMKDLQKTITEVREKIARLEGQVAPGKPVPGSGVVPSPSK